MIVWGGSYQQCELVCYDEWCDLCLTCTDAIYRSDGGRYDPSTDTWTSTSTGANVPTARALHTAVWTGMEMIVWGGQFVDNYYVVQFADDGGLYCACPSGTLYYRDADGDGYGDPGVIRTSCDGAILAGYVANGGDCNDASASVNPGAAEICNSIDDDCDGSVDNAPLPQAIASFAMAADASGVQWAPQTGAQNYDVVFGNLETLHSSGGDFTSATQGCVAFNTASTSASFSPAPGLGQAYWLLVRGKNCTGNGTYDSGDAQQVGSRDAEIEASPFACRQPPVCGDGMCNGDETCSSCPADCLTHLFAEDFSDNAAGWTLGPEWQIGPAQASSCGDSGADDPDTDHSATSDDGVAGVAIGGCATTLMHPYAYLESPAFDTSTGNAGVVLTFYRWLDSDQRPFMTSDVEVWNGSQWIAVWTQPSDGFPLFDNPSAGGPGWNLQQLDLTPYKNAAMRIRFGFKIEDPQVYSVGSWNIDDVRVSSAACP